MSDTSLALRRQAVLKEFEQWARIIEENSQQLQPRVNPSSSSKRKNSEDEIETERKPKAPKMSGNDRRRRDIKNLEDEVERIGTTRCAASETCRPQCLHQQECEQGRQRIKTLKAQILKVKQSKGRKDTSYILRKTYDAYDEGRDWETTVAPILANSETEDRVRRHIIYLCNLPIQTLRKMILEINEELEPCPGYTGCCETHYKTENCHSKYYEKGLHGWYTGIAYKDSHTFHEYMSKTLEPSPSRRRGDVFWVEKPVYCRREPFCNVRGYDGKLLDCSGYCTRSNNFGAVCQQKILYEEVKAKAITIMVRCLHNELRKLSVPELWIIVDEWQMNWERYRKGRRRYNSYYFDKYGRMHTQNNHTMTHERLVRAIACKHRMIAEKFLEKYASYKQHPFPVADRARDNIRAFTKMLATVASSDIMNRFRHVQ